MHQHQHYAPAPVLANRPSTQHSFTQRQWQRLGRDCWKARIGPASFDGVRLEIGYRIDILVEDIVVVEVKAVQKLLPIHLAQLLSYLKLGGLPVGLLINFHVAHLRHGIKRMVN
jgi:hypothetical protein